MNVVDEEREFIQEKGGGGEARGEGCRREKGDRILRVERRAFMKGWGDQEHRAWQAVLGLKQIIKGWGWGCGCLGGCGRKSQEQRLDPGTNQARSWGSSSRWQCKAMQSRSEGISLVVQWLRLCALNAGSPGLIPCQGTKIPHAKTKIKGPKCCN